jgi:dihydropteroate synthase
MGMAIKHGFVPPVIMGVLNVTPDSFSDGGLYASPRDAVARGLQMRDQGAQLIDVGGESTRPGAERVSEETELERVLPVIEALARLGLAVSIDTTRASVADAALQAGARVINDVSGGKSDPDMFALVAEAGVPYVLMHWRAPSLLMDSFANYQDVTQEVVEELGEQIDLAKASGVSDSQLVIDPGLGFAKNVEHNWRLLANLHSITAMGYPVLIGASRKRFLSSLASSSMAEPHPTLAGEDQVNLGAESRRDLAGAAVAIYAVAAGAWGVRTHDPAGVSAILPRSR